MLRSIRIPALIAFLLVGLCGTSPLAEQIVQLNGEHVAQVTHTFLRSHYSRSEFDDAHSRLMFQNLVDQYDPNHLYFLQSDVDEFRGDEDRLDDLIEDENIEIAFRIFERFKVRLDERMVQITAILDDDLKLDTDEHFARDRSNEPWPTNLAEAEALWRVKLKFDLLELLSSNENEERAKDTLRRRYRNLKIRMDQTIPNDVVSGMLNAFTAAYDPHSSYLSPDDLENFNIQLRLSLEGIGATLRAEDGYTIVTSIIPGGAADREGSLHPEDKIIAVGQGSGGPLDDVVDERLTDVVKLIRGPRGTQVRLSVLRLDGRIEARKLVTITRDKIVLKDGEAKGRILEAGTRPSGEPMRFGVITLPSFYVDFAERRVSPDDFKSSSKDVRELLVGFTQEAVDGVILDLRNNGGGGLDEAVSLSGLFLHQGPVVMVKDYRGRLSVLENPHGAPLWGGPMLVMTNRFSASASEILAGALKDYGRAILVGDNSTFGKGTVQNVITLRSGLGAVKTTVAKFYRPGSSSTQNRGVVPHVVLPSVNNHMEVGESSLKNALPWDSIAKADYAPWADLDPVLPVLRERSRTRLADNPDFRTVSDLVQTFLDNQNRRDRLSAREVLEEIRSEPEEGADNGESQRLARNAPVEEGKDVYLDESLDILADYIELNRSGGASDVARQSQM